MRSLVVVVVLASAGCSAEGAYEADLLDLAVGFAAKETCSCRFVSGRTEGDCADWTRVSPDVAGTDVGADGVTSSALLMWSAEAEYRGARDGCVLVADPD